MIEELPNELIIAIAGAFVLGCILTAFVSRLIAASKSAKQDPRDARIRALEAELRISRSESTDSKTEFERLQDELKETNVGLERRDLVIDKQQSKLEKASTDLKESVIKTRELRTELTERASDSLHAEAKIREVKTELSVAQASNDMIATGILDYSLSPNAQAGAELSLEEDESDDVSKESG
jgi:predicted RNase H-like nuclease (RuvC/YqgF family)